MAVYKVIQDIEAEDKLLGPLTLKGFIYAGIAVTCGFINFRLLMVGTAIKWVIIPLFAVPMILFGVLASPLGREQPTEVWLLSRIRFFLKPRKRIWDQYGLKELVTVTAPKKLEARLTKEFDSEEAKSRLKTLASMLDTRGWAIKNVDVNLSVPELEAQNSNRESDRLVGVGGMPRQMSVADVHAADDIMDEKNNPTAKKFDTMMKEAEAVRKKSVLATLMGLSEEHTEKEEGKPKKSKRNSHSKKSSRDLSSTKAALATMRRESVAERARRKAKEDAEIEERLSKVRGKFSAEFENGRKKTDPAHQFLGAPKIKTAQTPKATPVTEERQTDNMELAQSGSAFSVATLSKLANRPTSAQQTGPDEVTVSLH